MRALCAALLPAALIACQPGQARDEAVAPEERPALGLFTTLPIMWGEAEFSALLDGEEVRPWVRQVLERDYELEPLDVLGKGELATLDRLVLAQPRALAPAENVALDEWVREGGRLLLFADPMLTGHTRYPLGDKRRPQDVILLSPILARWGLELRYDTDQPPDERLIEVLGTSVPVEAAGEFVRQPTEAPADCTISDEGLLAQCSIGEGRVTVLADAALLEGESADAQSAAAIESLAAAAFPS